jgi:hypothetical protein
MAGRVNRMGIGTGPRGRRDCGDDAGSGPGEAVDDDGAVGDADLSSRRSR